MPNRISFLAGNPTLGPRQILLYAGLLVFLVVAWKLSRLYWNRRLKQWAESQQLQLVRFRGARFYEGPSAWTRSRNQHLFLVVTRDRNGLERSCWIMFGTFWGFTWGEPITKVEWTDTND
jgi:hypothetical protein